AQRPAAALGLPAGNTPRLAYADLVRRHGAGALSFARARAFSLDEYLLDGDRGLPAAGHPGSLARFLEDTLYQHVDFAPSHLHAPDVAAADPAAAADAYERAI